MHPIHRSLLAVTFLSSTCTFAMAPDPNSGGPLSAAPHPYETIDTSMVGLHRGNYVQPHLHRNVMQCQQECRDKHKNKKLDDLQLKACHKECDDYFDSHPMGPRR